MCPRPGKSCPIQILRPTTNAAAPTAKNAKPKATLDAIKVRPRARMRGAAVGRGTSTESGPGKLSACDSVCGSLAIRFILSTKFPPVATRESAPHEVDHRKHHHPDAVHKV